jgi:hypothetical protein
MKVDPMNFNAKQLQMVEEIICSYYDQNINLEGKDSVSNLLQQIELLQDEIRSLKR